MEKNKEKVLERNLEQKHFEDAGEASRATGISYTMINDCCKGFKKDYKNNKIYPCLQARGYKFKFNKNNGS